MKADENKYSVQLTKSERNHPLAQYYYKHAKVPKKHIKSLKYYGFGYGIRFDNINEMLKPGYLKLENGYTRFEDGTGYVAVNTKFPGASGRMLDWWFDWVGYEPLRYKIWYPGLHAQALYVEDKVTKKTSYSIAMAVKHKPEGKTKHTVEAIGENTGLKNLYITFVAPRQFGLDESKLGKEQWAFCAIVKSGHFEVARMVHFFRKTEYGAEMRSRFWLGKNLPWVIRRFAVTDKQLCEMAYHCAAEYTQLASFLPEVYKQYASKR